MKDVRKYTPAKSPLVLDGVWKDTMDIYGTLRQVLIQPENPNTRYDFGIKDESGMFIYLKYDQVGILASEDLEIIMFPGIKELIISNSSSDEEFKLKLIYQL